MISQRTKRGFVALLLFGAVLVVVAAIYGYLLTRDPGFELGTPNVVEAREFRRKVKLYNNSVTNNQTGFVRLSQLEINSAIRQSMTNFVNDTNATSGWRVKRVGIGLTTTNFTLHTWTDYRVANI